MKAPNHWSKFEAAKEELRKRVFSKRYGHVEKERFMYLTSLPQLKITTFFARKRI